MGKDSKKDKKSNDKLEIVLAIILLIIIAVLIFKVGGYLIDEISSSFFSKKLQETVLIVDTQDTESKELDSVPDAESEEEKAEETKKEIIIPDAVDFKSLQEINKEAVAWIFDPGVIINYPVAKAADNDFYLRRNLKGESSNAGTLFMDYRNRGDFSDWNTIIYGHNMKSGTMFASLLSYQERLHHQHQSLRLHILIFQSL